MNNISCRLVKYKSLIVTVRNRTYLYTQIVEEIINDNPGDAQQSDTNNNNQAPETVSEASRMIVDLTQERLIDEIIDLTTDDEVM